MDLENTPRTYGSSEELLDLAARVSAGRSNTRHAHLRTIGATQDFVTRSRKFKRISDHNHAKFIPLFEKVLVAKYDDSVTKNASLLRVGIDGTR